MKFVLQFAQCRGKDFCLSGYTAAQSPSLDKSLAGIEPWAVEVIGGPLVRFSQQVQSLEDCSAIPAIYGFSVAS